MDSARSRSGSCTLARPEISALSEAITSSLVTAPEVFVMVVALARAAPANWSRAPAFCEAVITPRVSTE